MRVPQSYIQKVKVVGHVLQSIFIFVAAIMTIVIFAKGGETGGPTGYYLAMVSSMLPLNHLGYGYVEMKGMCLEYG